ncbi:FitA-like ribbon-helix-helix domain-containing protein [Cerasicoccus arenae]|uniref:FitA-like ribbon-helix-helix domain-containing protein n=1 Tax=Cerasicoccus arenae TaxID=424488 RepID=UPI001675B1F7|nr:Arc family DNA-binding protein [Cerasicoccus arenae]MBK1856983.1 Arc family DNA-binding protein [Cerasicoccus arenae]
MLDPTGVDIPPELMRRLKFRARRQHRSLETEIFYCLNAGLAQEERPERFRDRARRLRQGAHGILRPDVLKSMIEDGRC